MVAAGLVAAHCETPTADHASWLFPLLLQATLALCFRVRPALLPFATQRCHCNESAAESSSVSAVDMSILNETL